MEQGEDVVHSYLGSDCPLLELPLHLFESITSLLDPKTLFALSCSCKFTFWLINHDDSPFRVWESKCLRYMAQQGDGGVEGAEGSGERGERARARARARGSTSSTTTFECEQHQTPSSWNQKSWKDLFFNVFYPWGKLLGVWQACCTPHGGLLKVSAKAPNITGYSIFTNRACGAEMKGVPVFQMSFNKKQQPSSTENSERMDEEEEEGMGDTLCYRAIQWMTSQGEGERAGGEDDEESNLSKTANEPHKAQVFWVGESGDEFSLSCCEDCEHDRFERRNRKICVMQAFLEYSAEQVHERIHSFYFRYLSESLTFDLWLAEMQNEQAAKGLVKYKRLAQSNGNHPLEGLWKGSYASHGVEFVNITRGEEEESETGNQMLLAEKISGDPHIWAGKVTFKIDLSTLVPLAEDISFPDVEFRDKPPEGLCPKLKYKGEGQIAEFGYKNPQNTPIELIVFGKEAFNPSDGSLPVDESRLFEDNTKNFAVNWISLDAFSMFEKISPVDLKDLVLQNRLTPYNTDNYQM